MHTGIVIATSDLLKKIAAPSIRVETHGGQRQLGPNKTETETDWSPPGETSTRTG